MKKIIFSVSLLLTSFMLFAYEFKTDSFEITKNKVVSLTDKNSAYVEGNNLVSTYEGTTYQRKVVYNNGPVVKTNDSIVDYLTQMAMEETVANITKDGVFSAGANWPTAWTRDMSYAIDLSLAFLFPQTVEKSLASRVEDNIILQDTGSGGSYPVSTDRVVWGLAAYDYALVKQSDEYFRWIYEVLTKTIEYDYNVTFDKKTGLFRGESSFLDWREQTYPRWMDNVYIADSYALGTNMVYYAALKRISYLANRFSEVDSYNLWNKRAEQLKESIVKNLWLNEEKYFGAYLISHVYPFLYKGYETLGESLAIMEEIVPSQEWNNIITAVKPGKWGMSVVAPQLGNVPSYHNDAVWPFVQGYRGLAAKKAKNAYFCEYEFASMIYCATLFRTFKENYVASTYSPKTQTNSDRQLWSDAGWLSYIYKILFGIDFVDNGIKISPFVFDSFKNGISLKNFTWNGNKMNISIQGTGDKVVSYTVNGKSVPSDYVIPYENNKVYDIKITLEKSQEFIDSYKIADIKYKFSAEDVTPMVPIVSSMFEKNNLSLKWRQKNNNGFDVFKNGKYLKTITDRNIVVPAKNNVDLYTVISSQDNLPCLPGTPVRTDNKKNTTFYEAENAVVSGGKISQSENPETFNVSADLIATIPNGTGFVEKWGSSEGEEIKFSCNAKKSGNYLVDFRFKNGHGPINTGEKCAVAAIYVNDELIRRVAMPQQGNWVSWNFTVPIIVNLPKGKNTISLKIDEYCYTQHHALNHVSVDLMRLSKVSD